MTREPLIAEACRALRELAESYPGHDARRQWLLTVLGSVRRLLPSRDREPVH